MSGVLRARITNPQEGSLQWRQCFWTPETIMPHDI
jgi:hypothetical protein